jgi:hypothetical protein
MSSMKAKDLNNCCDFCVNTKVEICVTSFVHVHLCLFGCTCCLLACWWGCHICFQRVGGLLRCVIWL